MIKINHLEFTYTGKLKPDIIISSLHIERGEFVIITGASGSGKSTLVKCINGLIPNFYEGRISGELFIDSQDVIGKPVKEFSQKVASVFQDPSSQFFTEEVNSELAFTCENFGIARKTILNQMTYAVELVEIENLLGQKLHCISSGQKQKVAIATALTLPVKILLLDEPSSNLDYASINKLGKLLLKLKNKNFTIVIAEHRLYYLKKCFDKLLYMQNGKIRKEFSHQQFSKLSNKELHSMGLRSLDVFSNVIQKESIQTKNEPIAEFKNFTFTYPKAEKPTIQNIDIDFYAEDAVALVGANGAGKTTLARLACGIYQSKAAKIKINGQKISQKDLPKKINFVMQDVSYQLFGDSVCNELKIGIEKTKGIDEKIKQVLVELGLWHLRNEHPFSLSMGERQRLVLATSYVRQTAVTILDEPTSGLDYLSMQKVSRLIQEITLRRQAVFIITHDYELIAQTCRRVLLLQNGTIAQDFFLKKNETRLKEIFLNLL